MTTFARARFGTSATKYDTPVALPFESVSIRSTIASVASVHRPVAIARGNIVLCEPFFESDAQAKPTHMPHCAQAGRPWNGTVLISIGAGAVWIPSCCAPRDRTACCLVGGTG